MSSLSLCPVCLRSIEDCKKEDEKLIKPFNKDILHSMYLHGPASTRRHILAYHYTLGTYNPINKGFYVNGLPVRVRMETKIKLPLCVWEGYYGTLQTCLKCIQEENLNCLQLPWSTKNKLRVYFEKQIDKYCQSLPTPNSNIATTLIETYHPKISRN